MAHTTPDGIPQITSAMIGTAGSHHNDGDPGPSVSVAMYINIVKVTNATKCPVKETDLVNRNETIAAIRHKAAIPMAMPPRGDPSK